MFNNAKLILLLSIAVAFSMVACSGLQPLREVETGDAPTSGVSTKEWSLREDIVDYAKKYQGAKYKYAGRSPKGFDCSGFTHYVMDEFNVDLTPVSRVQENEGKAIALKNVKPGDLIFFRSNKGGVVFHVALVVANKSEGIYVIHSTSSRGVVIDNITTNSYWSKKYATARDVLNR